MASDLDADLVAAPEQVDFDLDADLVASPEQADSAIDPKTVAAPEQVGCICCGYKNDGIGTVCWDCSVCAREYLNHQSCYNA